MEPLATAQVQCYLFDTNSGQYEDKGLAGIAIVGQPGGPGTYRLGCYIGAEYLCTADITNNNDTGIQWSIIGTGYASFRDDQQRIWSVSFQGGDAEAFQFSASIAVSMYGASNQPEGSVICCDVTSGKRERIVVPNDKVKARYTSWVVQRRDGAIGTACPKLGSQLESNDHEEAAYIYAAPLNHNNVTSDMKGFEGMTIGMAEESRRFIIVPKAARRGSGPNVHVCYMVYIVKKKDNAADEVEQWRSMQQNKDGTQKSGNNGQNQNQQGGGGNNGPITVVVQSGSDNNNNKKKSGALVLRNRDEDEDNNNNRDEQDEDGGNNSEDEDDRRGGRKRGGRSGKNNNNNNNTSSNNNGPSLPVPTPGFNFEQMDVINRMRDQVANLLMQIKETTSRVDLFSHDMRQAIDKSRPKSLSTAQMTHTMDSMLEETDSLKQTLEERDKTLRQLEDKNKDLQGKVDAFSATASRLSEEKKLAMAETSQVKIDGDQKTITLQSELTRIMSEREDTSRHLSSVKRLLEISDGDCKKEKQGLQTAEVQMTTVEAKMSSADEQLQEERGRRKLLESKITTLGDELRAVLEEIRVKESQIDERRRKMEADKLHYTQIMDEERNRAADEMRELRDELVQEITVRDRRYQEERARVARESFERGRIQGIEDGHNETAMEVDARMQMLVLEAQRHRSEVETIKVRLHQSFETADASRRHQESHCSALGRVVDELQSQIHASEVELRALDSTRVTAQAAAAEAITNAVKQLTRSVSRSDLLGVMHSLRVRAPMDTAFEADREKEERARAAQDHDAVVAWVKRRVIAPISDRPQSFEPAPALLTPWTEDVLPEQFQPQQQRKAPQSPNGLRAEFLDDTSLNINPVNSGPAMPQYVQEVERRQRELLHALHSNDPTLELIAPPKPPTPEPEPEPVVIVQKQPEPEEEEEQEKHADPNQDEDEWDEEEKQKLPPASNPKFNLANAKENEGSDKESEQGEDNVKPSQQRKKPPLPVQKRREESEEEEPEEDDQGYGYDDKMDFSDPAATKQQQQQQHDEDEDEEEGNADDEAEEEEEAQQEEEEEEEEEAPAPAPVVTKQQQQKAAAPASRQRGLFAAGSDDESEADSQPSFMANKGGAAAKNNNNISNNGKQAPAAAVPAKKAAATAAATQKLFGRARDDSEDEDSDEEQSKPVFRVAPKPATKQALPQQQQQPASKPAAKKGFFAETDSDDDSDAGKPPARKQPVAAAAAPAAKPVAKKVVPAPKKSLFGGSDSD